MDTAETMAGAVDGCRLDLPGEPLTATGSPYPNRSSLPRPGSTLTAAWRLGGGRPRWDLPVPAAPAVASIPGTLGAAGGHRLRVLLASAHKSDLGNSDRVICVHRPVFDDDAWLLDRPHRAGSNRTGPDCSSRRRAHPPPGHLQCPTLDTSPTSKSIAPVVSVQNRYGIGARRAARRRQPRPRRLISRVGWLAIDAGLSVGPADSTPCGPLVVAGSGTSIESRSDGRAHQLAALPQA